MSQDRVIISRQKINRRSGNPLLARIQKDLGFRVLILLVGAGNAAAKKLITGEPSVRFCRVFTGVYLTDLITFWG